MESVSIIAFQSVVMLILLMTGFFLRKKNFLSDETTKQLSNIIVTVINPILIFNSYQTEFNSKLIRGLLSAAILALFAHILFIAAAKVLVRKTHSNFETERFSLIYTNCGFMGIPLVEAAFGQEGVFYLTAYITAFNLFIWTHGAALMSGEKPTPKGLLKIVLSPAIIAICLGLVTFFTGIRLPQIIQEPLNYLGSMNTPLAMIVSGSTIASAGLKAAFTNKRVYLYQTLRLLILPAITAGAFALTAFAGVSPMVISVITIAASAPTASLTIMFAHKYGRNAGYASSCFALSTVFSMVTMPLISMLSGWLLNLIGK